MAWYVKLFLFFTTDTKIAESTNATATSDVRKRKSKRQISSAENTVQSKVRKTNGKIVIKFELIFRKSFIKSRF